MVLRPPVDPVVSQEVGAITALVDSLSGANTVWVLLVEVRAVIVQPGGVCNGKTGQPQP